MSQQNLVIHCFTTPLTIDLVGHEIVHLNVYPINHHVFQEILLKM